MSTWKTITQYVDQDTGEITRIKPNNATISKHTHIKTEKNGNGKITITRTKFYHRNQYVQQEIFGTTKNHPLR